MAQHIERAEHRKGTDMVQMIISNGIQYRPEDAKRLGIKPDPTPAELKAKAEEEAKAKAEESSANRARTSGDGDKAERPNRGRARTKKEPSDAGDAAD